ncbi:MAG: LamG domain-containing protein, partial [Bacteroidia bacterium]
MKNCIYFIVWPFILVQPKLNAQTPPPIAGFAYDIQADTAWLNSPYTFVNTSNNASKNYWDITGYSSTSVGGPFNSFSTTRQCNPAGCYIDTNNNPVNFKWTFANPGWYKVKLKSTNAPTGGNCNAWALSFNGNVTNPYAKTNAAVPALGTSFTLEYWIKYTDFSHTNTQGYARVSSLSSGYVMETAIDGGAVAAAGTLKFYTGSWQVTSVVLSLGVWTHIAWVINGGVVTLFVNGVPSWTGSTAVNPAAQTWEFGTAYTLTESATCVLDEIRIWNVARTQSAIQSTMNSCLSAQTNLVGYWNMPNGPSSSTVTDLSSNANNLTLYNMNTTSDWVAGYIGGPGAGSPGGADSITKVVVCAQPSRKPIASFFALNRTVGFGDQLNFYDLSLYGPTQWSWWLNPFFIGKATFAGSGSPNAWLPSQSVSYPKLFALDAGTFDVCLAAGNVMGWDTICRPSYLMVNNGYLMCNGSDSISFINAGYVYDQGGP